MPKKTARKTKKVTKTTKAIKVARVTKATPAVKSFTLTKKQDSYLPLLLVILLASILFFWITISLQ